MSAAPLAVLDAWLSQGPAPWFAPYDELARGLCERPSDTVAEALCRPATPVQLAAGSLRFVPQAALPADEAYEAFIARTASVPTRNNLHDLFNGLVWHTFPRIKQRLNELQSRQIAAQGGDVRVRGAVRDALTLFDENAALLEAPSELVQALRARHWHRLFVADRAAWRQARVVVFGHALLEQLLQPRKNLCAHVWVVPPGPGSLDERVAASLDVSVLGQRPRPFLPLPVLGVPGWWPANEDPSFYNDPAVFRPLPMSPAEVQGNGG